MKKELSIFLKRTSGKYFVTSGVILLCLFLSNCSGNSSTDKAIKEIATIVNEKCPMKITDDVRLDSVSAEVGKKLVYNYTIFLIDEAKFNKKEFENGKKEAMTSSIKSSSDMSYLKSLGTTFEYRYFSEKGHLLSEINISPKDYENKQ